MDEQILAIGVVQKGDLVLMRKKPEGSPPYKETWYLFGAYVREGDDFERALAGTIKEQAGVDVSVVEKIGEDDEVKLDLDGAMKHFIYSDYLCDYVGGELVAGPGIERLEWVPIADLASYDTVPPSVKLFKKLGYLNGD